jgi:hypothetical protein
MSTPADAYYDPTRVGAGSRVRHRYDKNIQSAYKNDYINHNISRVEIVKPQHAFAYNPIPFTANSTNKADFKVLQYSRRDIVPPMKASIKLGDDKFRGETDYARHFMDHGGQGGAPDKGAMEANSIRANPRNLHINPDVKFDAVPISRTDFVRYNSKPRKIMRPDNRSSLPLFDGPPLSYETDNSAAFVPLPYAARKLKPPLQARPLDKHKFTATSLYAETFPTYEGARPAKIARPSGQTEFQSENRTWETEATANYYQKPYVAERHSGPKPAGIAEDHPFVGSSVSQESYQPLKYSRRGIVPPMKASVRLGGEGDKFTATSMYSADMVEHKMEEKDKAKTFVPYKGVAFDHSKKFTATTVSRQDYQRYSQAPRKLMKPDTISSLPWGEDKTDYTTDYSSQFHQHPNAQRTIHRPLQAVPLRKHKFVATSLAHETFTGYYGKDARPAKLIKPDSISSHLW